MRTVECIIPILNVADLQASLPFYRELLGFTLDWGGEDGSTSASVSRDGHAIMLFQGIQGQTGTWIWVGVEDIAPLFADLSARGGAAIVMPPTNFRWAYEFRLADPDGHVLRFGSEPRADLPFADGGL